VSSPPATNSKGGEDCERGEGRVFPCQGPYGHIFCIGFYFAGFYYLLFHFWCRDLLRELDKKYEVLLIIFFLLFGGVLVSEALLFVSFFWTSFHSLSSITLGIISHEAFYLVL
jgi:hypothetical protein